MSRLTAGIYPQRRGLQSWLLIQLWSTTLQQQSASFTCFLKWLLSSATRYTACWTLTVPILVRRKCDMLTYSHWSHWCTIWASIQCTVYTPQCKVDACLTFAEGKPIPTELRKDEQGLRKKIELEDDNTAVPRDHIDDEYARAEERDPKILITTSRDPSSRLVQFAKEMKLVFPNSQRINRGGQVCIFG